MKKKIISMIGLALFVGAVAFNVQMNLSNNQTSDVTLNNIEALIASAQAEEPTGTGDCGTGYMYFCGYIDGIDHPDFYAYEGPWLT